MRLRLVLVHAPRGRGGRSHRDAEWSDDDGKNSAEKRNKRMRVISGMGACPCLRPSPYWPRFC